MLLGCPPRTPLQGPHPTMRSRPHPRFFSMSYSKPSSPPAFHPPSSRPDPCCLLKAAIRGLLCPRPQSSPHTRQAHGVRQWGAPGQVAPSEEQWLWTDTSGVWGHRLSVSLSLAQPPWTLPGMCLGPTSALASAALCCLFSWRVSCEATKTGHPPQVKGG